MGEGEVALLLLGEVQFEDGMEPVEESPEFENVGWGRGVVADPVEDRPGASTQPADLGVRAAHGSGRVGAAERVRDEWVELTVLGLLVGFDLA